MIVTRFVCIYSCSECGAVVITTADRMRLQCGFIHHIASPQHPQGGSWVRCSSRNAYMKLHDIVIEDIDYDNTAPAAVRPVATTALARNRRRRSA